MTYKMYLLDVSLWLRTEGEETDKEDIESRGLLLRGDTARKALALLCPERAEKVLRCRTVTGQAIPERIPIATVIIGKLKCLPDYTVHF